MRTAIFLAGLTIGMCAQIEADEAMLRTVIALIACALGAVTASAVCRTHYRSRVRELTSHHSNAMRWAMDRWQEAINTAQVRGNRRVS